MRMLVTCVIETRQNEEEDRLCCRLSQYSNLVVVVVRATEAATATIDEAYFWSTIHIQKQTLLSIQVEKEERETESKEREGEGKKERKTPERRKDDEGKGKRNSRYRNRNIKERANPK